MPLDPQVEALLQPAPEGFEMTSLPVDVLRKYVRESSMAYPKLAVPLASVADRTIAGPGGELPIRVYTPEGGGPFPLVVYFHGGGWVVGDLDTQDMICRALCHGAASVVVSVDYRLAPEHRFPAAVDDAWAATLWAAKNAPALRGDATRLAVAGDSAGANLAAAVALRTRDEGGPRLRAQLLIYGSCNYPSTRTPSTEQFKSGPIITEAAIDYFWKQFLADPAVDQDHPWASPARAKSHRDLAPAFVATAEMDPSRDDGERYGEILARAGVATESRRYAGMLHGFVSWVGLVDQAQRCIDHACAFLARHTDRAGED
ncbi:MAG: alpha/beta hydrolase [Deltaproteobacteria bacterium]|nr:alpha/beta hydrolase [Deltaproteobacteria bacterium]